MEVSRYIRPERMDQDGFCVIQIRVSWNQRKYRFTSGQLIKAEELIEVSEVVTDPVSGKKRERKKIQTKNRKINRILDTYSDCLYEFFDRFDGTPSEDQVQKEVERIRVEELNLDPKPSTVAESTLTSGEANKINLFNFWEQFVDDHKGILSTNYLRHYKPAKNHLFSFAPNADFADVTLPFGNRYVQYMMSLGVQDQYAYKQLKYLRRIMTYARKCGIGVPNDFEDFPSYRAPLQREALKWEEVLLLQAVELPDYLAKQRDVFLFQCYAGLRWSDLKQARTGNLMQLLLEDEEMAPFLKLVQVKGRKENFLPLSDYALQILEKYGNELPLVSQQKFNKYIKKAAKRAGLNRKVILTQYRAGNRIDVEKELHEVISSHIGRHTFAMMMLDRKVDITDLSDMMGHGSIETTMIYRTIRGEDKARVMKKAWGKISEQDTNQDTKK